ncbi:methylated-DNA--[protein]-cysteine S-methyltransferase [Brevibacterium casei]|uniref:methylated-DNA--[protein]-cysteine S-methyltransferase n=1 Tax=Brevibacterium casei TaxID=33889 RepID=UPI0024202BAA|nr:methylated-DNA--[protein]-cysteine S-methyltransferase [Brevibacterium casei]
MTQSRPETGLRRASLASPVGTLLLSSTGTVIVRVEWVDDSDLGAAQTAAGDTSGGSGADRDPLLAEALGQVEAYFDGRLGEFDLPLGLDRLSASATTVLTVLADTVPFGDTITYGELAARTGTAIPARAIGTIMGLNPLPLLIPCHRVVAGDGLGGYSGGRRGEGLETKRRLLEMEGALPNPLF